MPLRATPTEFLLLLATARPDEAQAQISERGRYVLVEARRIRGPCERSVTLRIFVPPGIVAKQWDKSNDDVSQ